MKTRRSKAVDAGLSGAMRAKRLAEETATPFYILKGGRIVDLNAQAADASVPREDGPRK